MPKRERGTGDPFGVTCPPSLSPTDGRPLSRGIWRAILSIPIMTFSTAEPPGMHVPHFVPEHMDWFPKSRSGTGVHMTWSEKFGRAGHTKLMFCGTFNIYQRLCSVAPAWSTWQPQKEFHHNLKRVTCPHLPLWGPKWMRTLYGDRWPQKVEPNVHRSCTPGVRGTHLREAKSGGPTGSQIRATAVTHFNKKEDPLTQALFEENEKKSKNEKIKKNEKKKKNGKMHKKWKMRKQKKKWGRWWPKPRKRVDLEGGGGGQKIRAFFSFSRRKFRSFFSLLGSFSWNCGRSSSPWPTQSARFGFSWIILCEPRGGVVQRGRPSTPAPKNEKWKQKIIKEKPSKSKKRKNKKNHKNKL